MDEATPKKRKPKRIPSFYDFPDGEAKLKRFMDCTKARVRDHALFLLLVKTAIRGVSALNARWQDITVEDGDTLLWTYGKTLGEDEKRWKILMPAVVDALNAWRSQSHGLPDDKIFGVSIRRVRQLFDMYKRKAEITDPVSVHSLRHTAITGAFLKGASPPTVQSMADHESMATTMIYAHAVRRRSDAAERLL